jgi:hypothetical protein
MLIQLFKMPLFTQDARRVGLTRREPCSVRGPDFWKICCARLRRHLSNELMLDLVQLDLSCILCAHPEHDFVTRRKRPELKVCKLVHNPRLHEFDRPFDVGRRGEIVDSLDNAVVEMAEGLAE